MGSRSSSEGIDRLADRDPALAAILTAHGRPPDFSRPPGFPTLIHIILEQQVSLASARAAFDRLLAAPDRRLTPAALLRFDDATLKQFGFSRQKTRYCRLLARAVLRGDLDLAGLAHLSDETARHHLTALTGIGPWTADIYLLLALDRPDIWPAGDLALQKAAQAVLGLADRPGTEGMAVLGERWRPYRSAAARLLWHYYLSERRPGGGGGG